MRGFIMFQARKVAEIFAKAKQRELNPVLRKQVG